MGKHEVNGTRRAVFLDRDGVINRAVVRNGKPYPPETVQEFVLLDGVKEACAIFKQAGFLLVVVTNQPDVGRGTQSIKTVEDMHATMCAELPIDHLEVCCDPHDAPEARRRKPAPGMLLDAAGALGVDLRQSFMIGDRWRDVDCGQAAGCTTVFIDYGYEEQLRARPDLIAVSLLDAARRIAGGLHQLRIKIFADGADREGMLALYADPLISGITTNPTLMNKAGIRDYEGFARDVLTVVRDKPISFEVFSDEFPEMRRQALKIRAWGSNVYVKIPVTNTRGEGSYDLIRELAAEDVKLNVTAVLTLDRVRRVSASLDAGVPAVVSVFAGRIADAGQDPVPLMQKAKTLLAHLPRTELLWGSVREVWNIFQADAAGCDIVTVPHDILTKAMKMAGMDLSLLSLETVRMFAKDAAEAGFTL